MAVTMKDLGIDRLSVAERLALVDEILESVDTEPEELSVPEWHLEIVRERLMSMAPDPDPGATWPELKRRLMAEDDGP